MIIFTNVAVYLGGLGFLPTNYWKKKTETTDLASVSKNNTYILEML